MLSRPQYCSFLQWLAQETTEHLMALLGVQEQPLFMHSLMDFFLLVCLSLGLCRG